VSSLPFSQACENNKPFILEVLLEVFAGREQILEIASGSGQHACHFAEKMPWLRWQPSELAGNLPLLQPRCSAYEGSNLALPLALDVQDAPWPVAIPTALFTANSLHIMAFAAVRALFARLADDAPGDTVLAVYGPFNYNKKYTSDSNARFDQWLAQRDPQSGIRDFEAVNQLAEDAGFALQRDCDMPANNRLLVWQGR